MTTVVTAYPELYVDPEMQASYKREKAWGLPFTSFDSFVQHSLHGADEISEHLGVNNPFSLRSDDIQSAASTALLTLRNRKKLSSEDFAQLCWLENSLYIETEHCISCFPDGARRYNHLLNPSQLRLVRDEIGHQERLDAIIEIGDVIELSNENIERDQYSFKDVINRIDSAAFAEESRLKRERVLQYLTNIS